MAKRSALPVDVEPADVEPPFSQLRFLLTDDVQERYEVARPLLLQRPFTIAERGRQTKAPRKSF